MIEEADLTKLLPKNRTNNIKTYTLHNTLLKQKELIIHQSPTLPHSLCYNYMQITCGPSRVNLSSRPLCFCYNRKIRVSATSIPIIFKIYYIFLIHKYLSPPLILPPLHREPLNHITNSSHNLLIPCPK